VNVASGLSSSVTTAVIPTRPVAVEPTLEGGRCEAWPVLRFDDLRRLCSGDMGLVAAVLVRLGIVRSHSLVGELDQVQWLADDVFVLTVRIEGDRLAS
jgi:hypothetical protein